eukprot:766251-Hanusia_phi.AAC.3
MPDLSCVNVFNINPSKGPLTGGTEVTISGSDFQRGRTSCRFGSGKTTETALFFSDTQISCVSPPSIDLGTVQLEVSVDISASLDTFTNSGVLFFYQALPSVNSLQPSAGPQSGGTQITLKGSGFENDHDSFCRFLLADNNHVAVPIRWFNPSEIVCISPSSDNVGVVIIDVTNNALDFSTTSVYFAYRLPESEVQITTSPFIPPFGFVQCKFNSFIVNGTLSDNICVFGISVTIAGISSLIFPPTSCKFRDVVTPVIRYLNSDEIVCVAPPCFDRGCMAGVQSHSFCQYFLQKDQRLALVKLCCMVRDFLCTREVATLTTFL